MIERHLTGPIKRAAQAFPVIVLTGPRQSGKTTLARAAFPNHSYINLEDPDRREAAKTDPRGFLAQLQGSAILDEVQRLPDLFSYLQGQVDEDPTPARFVLTGSENFLLAERISQSLAGRCAVFQLLPLSIAELAGRGPANPDTLDESTADVCDPVRPASLDDLETALFRGFYPRVVHEGVDAVQWLSGYEQTYVERDVRLIANIGQLDTFRRFVRLCAGRTAQILNFADLSNDAGISAPTARSWLSVLEASFLVRRQAPYFTNFSKRLVKSPKLYFLDTGLVCRLLGIRSPDDLRYHPLRGAIFETLVVSEFLKLFSNRGEAPPLYYWRDLTGHEVDVLVDLGRRQVPWEVKASATLDLDAFRHIEWWEGLSGNRNKGGGVIYGGSECGRIKNLAYRSWRAIS